MRTIILMTIILSSLLTGIATPHQGPELPDPSIRSVVHSPYIPTVNDTVLFQANIQLSENQVIDNITLHYDYNQSTSSLKMMMNTTTSYFLEINFAEAGQVSYHVQLFYDNRSVDVSSTFEFSVLDDQTDIANLVVESGTSIEITPGSYSITTATNGVKLNFSTLDSINISIEELSTVSNPPANTKYVSNTFDITSNNTDSMENITLSLNYNQSVLDELGVTPEHISMQKRENQTSEWQMVNSMVDKEHSRIITQPDSFSQWTLTVDDPYLQFLEVTEQAVTEPNKLVYINTVISNTGGVKAENVTVRMLIPDALTTTNNSLNVSLDVLKPDMNQSFTWIFSGQETGEYNLVSILESDNSEGDVAKIQIHIDSTSSTDTKDSQTESSINTTATTTQSGDISLHISYFLFIMIYLIGIKRKQKYET